LDDGSEQARGYRDSCSHNCEHTGAGFHAGRRPAGGNSYAAHHDGNAASEHDWPSNADHDEGRW